MTLTEADLRRYPEYADAENEWMTAQAVAKRSGDEAGELRAELAWTRKQREITDRIQSEVDRKDRLVALVEKTKKDHPYLPPALYEAITDPDQLEKVVTDLSAKFTEVQANQGWSPGEGPGDAASVNRRTKAQERRALIDKANTGDRQALATFKSEVWNEKVKSSPFLASQGRKARAGQNS